MPNDVSYHMSPEEFRRWGRAVVDWIADYQTRVETLPVMSTVAPGQIRASLPANPPEHGESFETILRDADRGVPLCSCGRPAYLSGCTVKSGCVV